MDIEGFMILGNYIIPQEILVFGNGRVNGLLGGMVRNFGIFSLLGVIC